MLRVGLTGGIGAGKSAAAAVLVELGAVVVDADQLAREVVEPGTPGLTAVVAAFGADILAPDGTLDRPKLGKIVFNDPTARGRLNAIVHPLIGARTAEKVNAAPVDAVLVHDVPLIVESKSQAGFHLVVVVMAPVETRLARLTGSRGMDEADAKARIAIQASDDDRVAAADVLLDNAGPLAALRAAVGTLWTERLAPYATGLTAGVPAPLPTQPGPPDPTWPAQFARAAARLRLWLGDADLPVAHVGPTANPDAAGPAGALDILDLRVTVPDPAALTGRLTGSGWILAVPAEADGLVAYSADPGRPARLYLAAEEPDPAHTR